MIKKAGIENLAILMWTETTVQDLIDEFTDIISKGYAKELLYECEKWAKEKGCKSKFREH